MCPPFGSDETIMAYVMPLGWGHPPHQFTEVGLSTLNKRVNAHREMNVVSSEDRELARVSEAG